MGTVGTVKFVWLLWVAMGLRLLTITCYDENQGLLMNRHTLLPDIRYDATRNLSCRLMK